MLKWLNSRWGSQSLASFPSSWWDMQMTRWQQGELHGEWKSRCWNKEPLIHFSGYWASWGGSGCTFNDPVDTEVTFGEWKWISVWHTELVNGRTWTGVAWVAGGKRKGCLLCERKWTCKECTMQRKVITWPATAVSLIILSISNRFSFVL